MTDAQPEPSPGSAVPPPGVDFSRPSAARIYDYLLGGTTNTPADRAGGEMMKARAPELVDAAFANRSFHRRAARWMAGQGIAQFIDIGSGLPTAGNTHDVVRAVLPAARVAYADNDPEVVAHGGALLAGDDAATVSLGDVRDPAGLLGQPGVRDLIDVTAPAGLLISAVLHFVANESDPAGLIAAYAAAVAPGSYIAVSHMTADHKPPRAVQAITQLGDRTGSGAYLRSRDEMRAILAGLELVPPYPGADPDVSWVGLWGCEDPAAADSEGSRWLYCGVGRVPG